MEILTQHSTYLGPTPKMGGKGRAISLQGKQLRKICYDQQKANASMANLAD